MAIARESDFSRAEWEPAEREVLSSGSEDVYGLWEILGGVNTALPELPADRRLELTRAVVLALLERGHVQLLYGDALGNGPAEPVAPERWEELLAEDESWQPSREDDAYLTLEGTDAGVEAYYRLGQA